MKAKFLLGLIATVLVSQAIHAKGEDALARMVQDEYSTMLALFNGGKNAQFNWNEIFKIIDQNSINAATFRCKIGGKSTSLLELAIFINRLDKDTEGSDSREKESFNAAKTLLEKYHIFKTKPCGGDNCDKLFALALESDKWGISEGYSNWDIVELLLKHGAKPNQKTMKDISHFKGENVEVSRNKSGDTLYQYDENKAQKMYPHIHSLINQK